MPYLWLKSFHLICMVAWFAGLFYIFRLFVYHAKHQANAELARVYSEMEYKLIYMIMHPAMAFTITFGVLLLRANPELWHAHWLHTKLTAVILLMAYQFYAGHVQRSFAKGRYILSERACRIINEVPTILLIAIVILAVVKP